MIITYKENPTDPVYPIMHGNTPMAKEFNSREKLLFEEGRVDQIDSSQVTTVLLEILTDDYNKRHALRKKKIKK